MTKIETYPKLDPSLPIHCQFRSLLRSQLDGRHRTHFSLLLLSLPLLPTFLPSLFHGTKPLLGLCKFHGRLFGLGVGIDVHWDIIGDRKTMGGRVSEAHFRDVE